MTAPNHDERDRALARLSEILGSAGWRVRTSGRGVRATWRWLSVTLKRQDKANPDQPWRARLRDGFPRHTVAEHWSADPIEALDIVIAHAQRVRRFADGRTGLVCNPSKSWLGHRLWQAVRPIEDLDAEPAEAL